jgi:hypothetical protein
MLLLITVHTVCFHCYIMNLSISHALVAWDPRVFEGEENILPHKLSPRLIIYLLLALHSLWNGFLYRSLYGTKGLENGLVFDAKSSKSGVVRWHPAKCEACMPSPILSRVL